MNMKTLQNPEEWAVETFGAAELGDVRRTDRLVKLASALGENPSVSLPAGSGHFENDNPEGRSCSQKASLLFHHSFIDHYPRVRP